MARLRRFEDELEMIDEETRFAVRSYTAGPLLPWDPGCFFLFQQCSLINLLHEIEGVANGRHHNH